MDIEEKLVELDILLTKLQIQYSDNCNVAKAIDKLEEIREMVLGPSK